ncbi:MAG: FAD-dependent oxidoreductase [Candidatus Omnitrophica bacterium]|nr:FAD-dependent oxidoreductase [Candidatus Omnitrophota bacterium]
MYDLIIVGAGPAGITASVYAARQKMNFLVLSKDIGGQAAWSGDIENYTGYQFISGTDLVAKFQEHLKNYTIELKENVEVKALQKENEIFSVTTNEASYRAKTVVLASGKRSKPLNVPGEAKFKNKGVTYCATCDGPLFANKTVAVVGGGNSALDATTQLINIAQQIYLINIAQDLTADALVQEKVRRSDQVSILNDTQISAILGDKMVTGIKIKTKSEEKTLAVQGVFVEIGLIPNSEFIQDVEKNGIGEIKVNCRNETSISGLFAAGDVTDVPEKQIIIAAGDGAKCALGAFRYLNRKLK